MPAWSRARASVRRGSSGIDGGSSVIARPYPPLPTENRPRDDSADATAELGGRKDAADPSGRRRRAKPSELADQTLKPNARNCSRPSSVILSGPHGGIHTQFRRTSLTKPPPGPVQSAAC